MDWRVRHRKVITQFLDFINGKGYKFVLKGGTALMLCYGLNRFSEDIDLDSQDVRIVQLVANFCAEYGYNYIVKKDTSTVRRCMIDYGSADHKLKVEVSYRQKSIPVGDTRIINGILTYNIGTLAVLKASAYAGRDKLRDLFDITFIVNNFLSELSSDQVGLIRSILSFKGIEQYDYLISQQDDPLIDKAQLADEFLKTFDLLELLYAEPEILSSRLYSESLDQQSSSETNHFK